MSLVLSGNSGSLTVDSSNGITFPNSTTQASGGKVIQVVQATYSTQVTTSSSSYIDTGLTVSITPLFSTSKILVMIVQAECQKPNNTASGAYGLQLVRNSTVITNFGLFLGYNASSSVGGGASNQSCIYLDSPATTSSTTYKTQVVAQNGVTGVFVQGDNSTSTITLMEIAQ